MVTAAVSRCLTGLRLVLASLLLGAPLLANAAGGALQRIEARGVVNACTNLENRPFAYLTPSGEALGFNLDLLEDLRKTLSDRLGRPIVAHAIATSGANRVPFVDQGKCDVIITGFSVTAERQRLVDFIFPGIYASGAVLLTPEHSVVPSWQSLRGATVCSSQGSTYNQALMQNFGVHIAAFAGLTESAQALRDGRCVGQVMDEAVARLRLQDSEQWRGYRIQLPVILEAPWSMAIAKGDPQWQQLLTEVAQRWHQSGFIYALESHYGLVHKQPLDPAQAPSPATERQALPVVVQRLAEDFEHLNARTGWNFPVFYEGWTARQFVSGISTTLQLSAIGILGSCLIGLLGAVAMGAARPVRWLVQAYVELLRNTPSLAQLYFIYFGVGAWLRGGAGAVGTAWLGNPFGLAALCITLHYSAFAIEIFRAGLAAVPASTRDAALALGYGALGRLWHIELPLALRACLPALGNNMVQLVKGTAIAYAVAVPEVLYSAQEIWSERYNVVEMMLLVLLTYFAIMAVLAGALHWLERRLQIPGAGR